jgi:hypothetical protein
MRLLLQILSLNDRYERKARLLPGLIAASPVALTAAAISAVHADWYVTLGATAGIEFLLAFLLGHLARARGKAIEEATWQEWGGPPTTRWLRPADPTCSEQQKSRWRGAFKRITNLTIPASVTAGRTDANIDQVINDATRHARYSLRDRPEAAMVRIHNEDYGFVRNLLGLRWHWLGFAVLSVFGCFVLLMFGEKPWVGFATAGGSLIVAALVGRELPTYMRRCADRYAESFFAALVHFDESKEEQPAADKSAAAKP